MRLSTDVERAERDWDSYERDNRVCGWGDYICEWCSGETDALKQWDARDELTIFVRRTRPPTGEG